MVRWLYILGVCAMLATAAVVGLWWCERGKVDQKVSEFLNQPGVVQTFSARGGEARVRTAEDSPLVVQAKLLASILDSPALTVVRRNEASGARDVGMGSPPAPAVRPAAPSVRFRLCATSYYPNEPKRSMALISELGSPEGEQRWVKEGARLGHFVIHEIRKGLIVYRDGEQLREMAVEHGASLPGIVRDSRLGSRQVSSAVDGATDVLSVPAGPNSVESVGGNSERSGYGNELVR